jgi:hypothetical protein
VPRTIIRYLIQEHEHSLCSETPESLRLRVTGGCGFVYEPVVLEKGEATYFVDWGSEQRNQRIEKYIKGEIACQHGLHTFLFAAKKVCF